MPPEIPFQEWCVVGDGCVWWGWGTGAGTQWGCMWPRQPETQGVQGTNFYPMQLAEAKWGLSCLVAQNRRGPWGWGAILSRDAPWSFELCIVGSLMV